MGLSQEGLTEIQKARTYSSRFQSGNSVRSLDSGKRTRNSTKEIFEEQLKDVQSVFYPL